MAQQSTPVSAFQAASAIDPSSFREFIVALTIGVAIAWSALHLKKVLAQGWSRLDVVHIGIGLFLILILAFFVFWVTAEYGTGS